MKTAFIFFLLGALAAVGVVYIYQSPTSKPAAASARDTASSLTDKAKDVAGDVATSTREAAGRVKDTVANKLDDWHLTPDEIKADLAKTGQVVRSKAHAVGESLSDARTVAVIKAKYVLDRDLSALDISIDANAGEITLRGAVASPELVGHAVQLALDTDGVRKVTAKLTVSAKNS